MLPWFDLLAAGLCFGVFAVWVACYVVFVGCFGIEFWLPVTLCFADLCSGLRTSVACCFVSVVSWCLCVLICFLLFSWWLGLLLCF